MFGVGVVCRYIKLKEVFQWDNICRVVLLEYITRREQVGGMLDKKYKERLHVGELIFGVTWHESLLTLGILFFHFYWYCKVGSEVFWWDSLDNYILWFFHSVKGVRYLVPSLIYLFFLAGKENVSQVHNIMKRKWLCYQLTDIWKGKPL